ncbi:MAG TPA: hypothetical protein VIH59_22000, partial [Candidatus Tectomicrobia bacterium]
LGVRLDCLQSYASRLTMIAIQRLSIKPGDLRGTSEAFAQLVGQMFDAWPQLAKIFGPGLSSLVKELPARQLHGLWPLVLRVRADDGPV